MKEVQLNKNKIALVDEEDFIKVREFCWTLNSSGYAVVYSKVQFMYMHRLVLNLSKSDELSVDHINGDKLDNRKSNLRICGLGINGFNKKTGSKFRGVSRCKLKNKWRANIVKNGKQISLGYHDSEISAHEAYKKAALELYGFLPYELKEKI